MKEIAKNHKKTIAQVAIKWLIQRDIVVTPKLITPKRLQEKIKELTPLHLRNQVLSTLFI